MERDWHSMEKMLDAQATTSAALQAARIRSIRKIAAVTIVLSSLFVIGTETQTDPRNVQMQAAVGMVGPRIEVKTESPTASLHSFVRDCDDTKRIAVTNIQPIAIEKSHLSRNQTNAHVSSEPVFGIDELRGIEVTKRETPSIQAEKALPHIADHGKEGGAIASSSESLRMTENIQNEVSVDSITVVKIPEVAKADSRQEQSDTSRITRPRLIITGLVSPDFSTTSLTKYSKPSGVFGILVGYKIFKRVTVMTGVTKSLKKYEGYGTDYSPPEGYWQNRTNGVVPDEVEGKCGIIEVPVLLQFDLVQRSRGRFFITSGVSSYFMRSENYQYTFNEPNPGAASSWTARKPSQYLFKIGHLSAGYDRTIGKNLSIGIEPFLKAPFEGIGWTDINLYSTGAYMNVRYTILNTEQ